MITKATTHKGIILALSCAAQFMVILDVAIVNVALPSIQHELGIGQNALQWIITAYGLMLGGFLLLGGRMGDLLGRRRIFLAGLVVFSGASLLAGLADSAELLIGARALQGLGAAFVAPAALSTLAVTFPEGAERNRAIGIFGAVAGVSATVGVIASGLLSDGPGWRWIFLINVPVGILLIDLAARFLARDAREARAREFDVAGAVTATGGLMLLVYALSRTTETGWNSPSTLGLFAAAGSLLLVFLGIEAKSRSPLVPASAVRNRTLVAANLSAFLLFGAFFSFIFLGSLLMQQMLGYSPTKTGVAWLGTTVISFFAAAFTGAKVVGVLGVRRVLVVGLTILAVAGFLLTRIEPGAEYATDLLPALLLAGIAGGMCAPAVQLGALSGVAPSMSGLASGLLETFREIGGAIAVAVVATVLVSAVGKVGSAAQAASEPLPASAFQDAFWVITIVAIAGALTAASAFPRRTPHVIETTPPQVSAIPEPTGEVR